jgi:tetratricopeptide (TPR) repeat protein
LAYLFLIFLREKLFVDLSYETTLHPTPIPNAVVGRIEIWQGTWPIISNHFFWGAGLRSFEDMFKHFNNPFVVWPRPHAHNLFLHVTSEIGMVGMLFFIIFILNILLSGIKNYKQTEDIRLKIIPFFLLVTILGFFFNNLVEYNWEHSLFQVLFYFSASSMFAAKKFLLKGKEEIAFHLTKFRKISFLGVLTLFWVFYVGSPAIGNYYLHEAHKSIAKEDLRSLDYLKKTSFFDPSDPEPYLLLSQIYERAYRNTKNRVFLENAIHAQTKVTNLLPMNADFHLDLAKLYEDAKRMEEAQFYYKKAIDINPFMPQYKEELASFLGRIKKTEKAIILWEDLKTFLEKYEPRGTHLMKVYLCLGINYRKKGDLSLAKKNLGAVINFQDSIGEKETPDSFSRRDFISYKKIADDELKSSKK